MEPINELEPELARYFYALRQNPPRDPIRASQARRDYLQAAQAMRITTATPQPQTQWNAGRQAPLKIKWFSRLIPTLAVLTIIVIVAFGGVGATLAAAQSSLPEQPLYTLKLWSEQTRLALNTDPQEEWQLALEFATRRGDEIQALAQKGIVPGDPVQARYQEQVEQAIYRGASLPGLQAEQALKQVRQRLQTQAQTMLAAQNNTSPQVGAALVRAHQMLRERLRWIDEGLEDPSQLQQRFRNGQPSSIPGDGSGNPWPTGTLTPGSGYGPGPGTCSGCKPTGTSQGPGPHASLTPTPGSSNGDNPWTTGTPTPGSSYGPGPGTSTPGTGPGPLPTEKPGGQTTPPGPQPTQGGQANPTGTPQGSPQGTPGNTPQGSGGK